MSYLARLPFADQHGSMIDGGVARVLQAGSVATHIERAASSEAPALKSFRQEKSPGRYEAQGLVQQDRAKAGMRILHGWQFACNVATGGKVCGITSA